MRARLDQPESVKRRKFPRTEKYRTENTTAIHPIRRMTFPRIANFLFYISFLCIFESRRIFSHFSISTRLPFLCTAPHSNICQFFVCIFAFFFFNARTRVRSTPEKTEVARPKSKHPKTHFLRKEKREKAPKAKWKEQNPNNELAKSRQRRA